MAHKCKIEDNILKMPDFDYNWTFNGLGELFFQQMKLHGNKIAQIYAPTGEKDTFSNLLQRCVRTAIWLKRENVASEDVVCSCTKKDFNQFVPFIATHLVGAKLSCLQDDIKYSEAVYMLDVLRPKFVFVDANQVDVIEEAVEKLHLPTKIVVCGKSDKYTEIEECLQEQDGEKDFVPSEVTDLRKTALISFSSGTTGEPKPICLSHQTLLHQTFRSTISEDKDEDKLRSEFSRVSLPFVVCNFSQLYWISGALTVISTALNGCCFLICQQFDAKKLWQLIDTYKIGVLFLSAPQIKTMCRLGRPQNVNTSSLLRLFTGGSPISKQYLMQMRSLVPETDVYQIYAQTETGGGITSFDATNKHHIKLYTEKATSCGLPGYGMWYKVVDPKPRQTLGPNEEGELRVKSIMTMTGYYNSDVHDYCDSEGFLKTGDLVYYDNDFCFYIVGRIREIIKYGSAQVSPLIIEQHLLLHPSVKEVAVIGRPNEIDGEHPMAVIVLEDGAEPDENNILKYVENNLNDWMRLRGGVVFVDSLPYTPTGKIKRRDVKRDILSQL